MSDSWHLAIDFGTSNTSAAHTAPLTGATETLSLSHRSNLMPSAVFVGGEEGNLDFVPGENALVSGRRDPARLVMSPKRYIDHEDISVAGMSVDTLPLIASVLNKVLSNGKAQHAGEEPGSVTLTHPEAWSVHSVSQLTECARAAGIDPRKLRLISEPRAAAVHYAAQQDVPAGDHVAVFDFGGGTLDIAVLRSEGNGNFQVVATKGDNSLGGRTVDNLLFKWLFEQVGKDDPDLADYIKNGPISVMHSLDASIREAKELLSDTSTATIVVSTPQGEHDLLLTRDEFNGVIDEMVGRACELTRAALAQSGAQGNTPIYMTGGSSRIPYMQDRLAEIGTVMTLDDPKTVVPRGALRATLRGFTHLPDGTRVTGQERSAEQAASANPFERNDAGTASAAGAAHAAGGNPFASGPAEAGPEQGQGAPSSSAPKGQQGQPGQYSQDPQQTAAFAQPHPGQGNASGSTATSGFDGQGEKKSGNRAAIIAVGVVAALAVVGGGAWAVLGRGGADNGGEAGEQTTAVAQSEAAGDSQVASAAEGTGSAQPSKNPLADDSLNKVDPELMKTLPAGLTNTIYMCSSKAETRPTAPDLIAPMTRPQWQCFPSANSQADSFDSNIRYITLGDDAEANFDFLKDSNPNAGSVDKLQDASGDAPEVYAMKAKDDKFGTGMFAYYSEKKILVAIPGDYKETPDSTKEWAKKIGFIN